MRSARIRSSTWARPWPGLHGLRVRRGVLQRGTARSSPDRIGSAHVAVGEQAGQRIRRPRPAARRASPERSTDSSTSRRRRARAGHCVDRACRWSLGPAVHGRPRGAGTLTEGRADADDRGARRHRLCDHGAGADRRAVADRSPCSTVRAAADEHLVADRHRAGDVRARVHHAAAAQHGVVADARARVEQGARPQPHVGRDDTAGRVITASASWVPAPTSAFGWTSVGRSNDTLPEYLASSRARGPRKAEAEHERSRTAARPASSGPRAVRAGRTARPVRRCARRGSGRRSRAPGRRRRGPR